MLLSIYLPPDRRPAPSDPLHPVWSCWVSSWLFLLESFGHIFISEQGQMLQDYISTEDLWHWLIHKHLSIFFKKCVKETKKKVCIHKTLSWIHSRYKTKIYSRDRSHESSNFINSCSSRRVLSRKSKKLLQDHKNFSVYMLPTLSNHSSPTTNARE